MSTAYASKYTVPRMMNAQNTKKCAAPGIDHLSSLLLAEDLDHLALQRRAECAA